MGSKLRFNNTAQSFKLIVALSNSRDSIYPYRLPHIEYDFTVKDKGWNYFELDGFDYDIKDFKYILIILLPPPGKNMGLGTKWLRKKEIGLLQYNQRATFETNEMYFVKATYLNGEEITDFTLDFRLHYTK
jgi:hypothetical protein